MTMALYGNSTLSVKMNNRSYKALVDSGSCVNCIRLDVLKENFPELRISNKPSGTNFKGANDTKLNCVGIAKVPIKFLDNTCISDIHVFDNIGQRLILGRPFLMTHNVIIDYGRNTFLMHSKISDEKIEPIGVKRYNAQRNHSTQVEVVESIHDVKKEYADIGIQTDVDVDTNHVHVTTRTNINRASQTSTSGIPIPASIREHSDSYNQITQITTSNRNIHTVKHNTDNTSERHSNNDNIPNKERLDSLGLNLKQTPLVGNELLKVKQLLGKHAYVFAKDESELGKCEVLDHGILVNENATPLFRRPYRVSPNVQKEVDRQLENLQKIGVIEEVLCPAWSNPLLTVAKGVKKSQKHISKPSSGIRICIDYRALNEASCKTNDRVILPTARELLDSIGKNKPKYISQLDLRSGFWQITLAESSRDYTAFAWGNKFFRWCRLPMGLATSSFAFQRVMHKVLDKVIGKGVVVYLDDIICYSSSMEEHLKLLEYVFTCFEHANLRLHPSKCSFFATEGVFLGFNISEDGISISNQHLRAIREYPRPTNAREVRTIIGLFSFFREFIDGRARLMQSLIKVSKDDIPFEWADEQEEAFLNMRNQLASDMVLAFPDFDKEFVVQTDASGIGIGGLLLQMNDEGRLRPICYAGRALNKHEKNASSAHLELLALVYCIIQFDVYLADKHFDVYTDCLALKYIFKSSKTKLNKRMARLVLSIEGYDFTVHHKKGSVNRAADALSRAKYTWDRTPVDEKIDQFPNVMDDDTYNAEFNTCAAIDFDMTVIDDDASSGMNTSRNINRILHAESYEGTFSVAKDNDEIIEICESWPPRSEEDIILESDFNDMISTLDSNDHLEEPYDHAICVSTRNKDRRTKMPKLIRYYTNLEKDDAGRNIEEYLSSNNKRHKNALIDKDALNWLLPEHRSEDSEIRWPNLNVKISKTFVENETCRGYFFRVYEMMLSKLGYEMIDTDEGTLNRTTNHTERFECLIDNVENEESISRLLKMMQSLGYEKWQGKLILSLCEDILSYKNSELANTFMNDWSNACINNDIALKANQILAELLQGNTNERIDKQRTDSTDNLRDTYLFKENMLLNENTLPETHVTRETQDNQSEPCKLMMKYGYGLDKVIELQQEDTFCNDLITYLTKKIVPNETNRRNKVLCREFDYHVEDGILYHNFSPIPSQSKTIFTTIVVPTVIQQELVQRIHESCLGAHVGPKKLYNLIRQHFSIPQLYLLCNKVCISCIECQRNKKTNPLQKSVRTLFEVSTMPWERVHYDTIGPFVASSTQMKYIFILVDSYSGFIIAWPMRNITTQTIVKNIYTKLIHTYGTPRLMVSDRAPQHLTEMFTTMMTIYGIELKYTVPSRAACNGVAERGNQSIINCLRTLTHDFPKLWDSYLPAVVSAMNNTIHDPIGLTPYTVIYGVPMRMGFDNDVKKSVEQPVHEIMEEILETQRYADKVASNLNDERAKKAKLKHDKENLAPIVVPGTVVYVKKFTAERLGESKKLHNRFNGPYLVVTIFNGNATLRCMLTGKFHKSKINIDQLKVPNYYKAWTGTFVRNVKGTTEMHENLIPPTFEYNEGADDITHE